MKFVNKLECEQRRGFNFSKPYNDLPEHKKDKFFGFAKRMVE